MKNLRIKIKKEWIIQSLISVCVSILTVIFAQSFHAHNLRIQMKLEFERETAIAQLPLYNRIKSLIKNDSILTVTTFTPTQITTTYIDPYGNIRGRELKKEVKMDTLTITAPFFIFNDATYSLLIDDLEYIKENRNMLDPTTYTQMNKLIIFLEEHPIPNKKNRISEILYHWGKKEVYTEYYQIIRDLNELFRDKVDKYF